MHAYELLDIVIGQFSMCGPGGGIDHDGWMGYLLAGLSKLSICVNIPRARGRPRCCSDTSSYVCGHLV